MQEDHIRKSGSFTCGEEFLQRKVFIRLIDHEANLRMFPDQFGQELLTMHLSCRIIRVAEPYHTHVLRHCLQRIQGCDPMPVHAAGIGIFAERRHQDGRIRPPEGLRYQINGFCGTIRHANRSGRQSVTVGQTGL